LAEEARLAEEKRQEELRLAEQQRMAELKRQEEERKAELARIAERNRLEALRVAEEKRKAEEARHLREEEEKRLAEEERLAEIARQEEEARRREEERLRKEQEQRQREAEARRREEQRQAELQAEQERLAEEQHLAEEAERKAEEARLQEEEERHRAEERRQAEEVKRKAEEAERQRQLEEERHLTEQRQKAEEAARLSFAEQQRQEEQATAQRQVETQRKIEEETALVAEQEATEEAEILRLEKELEEKLNRAREQAALRAQERQKELERQVEQKRADDEKRQQQQQTQPTTPSEAIPVDTETPEGSAPLKSEWARRTTLQDTGKRRSMILRETGTKERILKAQNAVRQRVCTELLETERSYVKNLSTVQELLINPLLSSIHNGMRIMKDSEFFSCFANISDILDSHRTLLASLEERFAAWNDEATVGDIFLNNMEMFSQYRQYLVNYNISIVAVQGLVAKYPRFAKLVEFFERAQQQTTCLNLESFLIMPVQRIPRYLLLMRDMLKYTHKRHTDYGYLTKALTVMGKVLQEHNKGIDSDASDHAHKLLAIGNSIANVEDIARDTNGVGLIKKGRHFLFEGEAAVKQKASLGTRSKSMKVSSTTLKKLDTKGTMKPYLFLFDDMIMHCEQLISHRDESERPFIYANILDLVQIKQVQTVEKEPKAIRLLRVGESFWTIKTKTVEECQQWAEHLRRAVAKINGTS